jgi:trimeric autotransporter adhesin
MFKFLLGVLILASNFLVVSRAIAQMDAGSGLGVPTAAASPTPFCQTATQIKSLQDLRTNVGTTGNYCLANDIDASDTATNPFTPIGSQTTPFVGVFDGNGYVIDKLTLAPAVNTGFFGEVGSQGRVRNVGITNGKIGPSSNPAVSAGLLVGFNSGVVASCFATGTVASSASFVGGLIGDNHGTVTKSRARAMVIPSGGGGFATGGLVGFNDATISIAHATTLITQSYASGDVFGSGGNQSGSYGGFVGANNDAGATITKSYATGNVVGPPGGFDGGSVGGFVGLSAGPISQSYATGGITGARYAGGFVGFNRCSSTISQSYSVGLVTGSGSIGGFVGFIATNGGGAFTSDYWDTMTSGQPGAGPTGTTGLTHRPTQIGVAERLRYRCVGNLSGKHLSLPGLARSLPGPISSSGCSNGERNFGPLPPQP